MAVADQIIRTESGGDPNAKNPRSSATGPSQFISSTWLDMLARHRPDIVASTADLLAMRSDPQLSRQMTEAYAADNGALLSKAGHPVNAGTSYLAHFAGPAGAVGLLNADPSTPAASIMGAAAMKANPFLAGMSAGDVAAWASRKMGGQAAPMSMAGPAQQAASSSMAAAPPPPAAAAQAAQAWSPSPPAAPELEAPPAAPQMVSILPQRKLYQIPPFSFRGYS